MELTFVTLEVENFRSFSAKQKFALAPTCGLWFLRGENAVEPQLGSNGAGKSSLFEALCWCVYGRTSRGLRNPDVRPWRGKGVPTVTLTLDVDGKRHTISRTAKTNGLTVDGVESGPEEGANLLRMPFEVFVNTVFLAQGSPLFFDRSPKEKFQLFMEVLPITKWEERSARAAKRAKELEELRAELIGEACGLEAALTQNEQLLAQAKKDAAEWQEEHARQTQVTEEELRKKEAILREQEDILGRHDLRLEEAWLRVREMREDVSRLRKTADSARRQFEDEERRIAALGTELQSLNKELRHAKSAKTCPTCGQEVKKLPQRQRELEEMLREVEEDLQAGINPNVLKLYKGSAGALKNFEAQLLVEENNTDVLQRKVNVLRPTVEQLRAAVVAAQDQRRTQDTTANPYTEQVQGLRRSTATLRDKLEGLREDQTKAEQLLERTRYWVKGFKDLALSLIEEVMSELETTTNAILAEVGLSEWRTQWLLERETKSGTLQRGISVLVHPPEGYTSKSTGGGAVRWESWSGGEEQRLRIVGAVALSEVLLRHAGVSVNLEVFDEPAKYLSGAGVEELCAYLSSRAAEQGKTIWLVDHLAREGSVFSGTAVVRKTPTGSVVVQSAT